MHTALDLAPDTLDEGEQRFVSNIREHGWFRTSVFEDEEGPGFSYSTGFWLTAATPEIIVFSLGIEVAHNTLWQLYAEARDRVTWPVATATDSVFESHAACFFPVARRHYAAHLGWSDWFYRGAAFPCLQLVWSDQAGRFPWQDGADPDFSGLQPDLSEHGWAAEFAR